jgi:hypothetical protein
VTHLPAPTKPSLAQRAAELRALKWPDATVVLRGGRELQFRFSIAPSPVGRLYSCLFVMKPDSRAPRMRVLEPDLNALAGGRKLPHVYPHKGPGVSLCLWWPKRHEWQPPMKLMDSYLAWTSQWLWYFEDWLLTGEWSGGGEHPDVPRSKSRLRAFSRRPATLDLTAAAERALRDAPNAQTRT